VNPTYQYQATIVRVIDGDTLQLDVDLGFTVRARVTFRLADIDAPEQRTPAGPPALSWLASALPVGACVIAQCTKQDRYGRWLARIFVPGCDLSINQLMMTAGHATIYDGQSRRSPDATNTLNSDG